MWQICVKLLGPQLKLLYYLNKIYFHLVFVGFQVKQEYNKLKTLLIKKSKKAWNFFTLNLQFASALIYLKYFQAHSFLITLITIVFLEINFNWNCFYKNVHRVMDWGGRRCREPGVRCLEGPFSSSVPSNPDHDPVEDGWRNVWMFSRWSCKSNFLPEFLFGEICWCAVTSLRFNIDWE